MDARMTKRYAAMLVAGAAGMATALSGCGGSEPSKTAGTSSTSTASTSGAPALATVALPATVDLNNPAEVAAVLKTLGVETPATEPLGTDRSGGADGVAFPTWPAGEVRKAGLATYRIDASGSYADDGTLKFMKGGKTLYEAAFKPTREQTEAAIPAAVTDALKVGDTVTWGVWFANKKMKPVTVSFTVVDKPAVTKAEAKFSADKSLDPVVRSLAMAQMLQNYRLYSEAVSVYSGVLAVDGRISSVYKPIADSLASLKLKGTPLFDLAKSRMVSSGGSAVRPTGGGESLSKGPGPQPVAPHTSGAVPPPVVTPPADATPAEPAPAPDDGGLAGPVPPPIPSGELPNAPHTPVIPQRPIDPSAPALPPGEQAPADPVAPPSIPSDAPPTTTPTLPVPAAPITDPALPVPAAPITDPALPVPAAPITDPVLPVPAAPITVPVGPVPAIPTTTTEVPVPEAVTPAPEGASPSAPPEGELPKDRTPEEVKKAAEKAIERARLEAKKAADRAAEEARAAADRAAKKPK